MVGNFADVKTPEQKAKINNVTKWYKPWFYKHVETFLQKVLLEKNRYNFITKNFI